MGDEEYLDLEQVISRVEAHVDSAPQRIRAYYLEDELPPEGYSSLEDSPAQMKVNDAADLIQYEFRIQQQRDYILVDGNWAYRRSHYIHLAVASELLLNAFYLKDNPEEYAERLEENDTLNLREAKKYLLAEMGSDLNGTQCKRISLVIDFIRQKRNNYVHSGFHSRGHQAVSAPIYEVLSFLFNMVSEDDLDIISRLEEKAKQQRRDLVGMEIEKIEFPQD